MTPEEAVALHGNPGVLREIYLPETIVEKVEDTIVAGTFFEDVPF
jgi:hypothetical protein